MRSKCIDLFLLIGFCAFGCFTASAQTDISASVYGAFSGTTNANGTTQSPANAAGGMVEVRHISNPIVGYEVTYSINRANQEYSTLFYPPTACPAQQPCGASTQFEAISANAHEVTGDWVVSLKIANIKPFALAGVGVLFNQPTGGQLTVNATTSGGSSTTSASVSGNSAAKPVFVYGGGLDWGLVPHLGLRFQYRGNLNKAPNLTSTGSPFTSATAFVHTAEPMIGAYLRF